MDDQPRDVRLLDLPGYMPWSTRKLDEGASPALIAHLDATCMWLRPDEIQSVGEDVFEDLLADLVESFDKSTSN